MLNKKIGIICNRQVEREGYIMYEFDSKIVRLRNLAVKAIITP